MAPIDANSTKLAISPDEVAALTAIGPLVPTPRAAKRLVNVYRLIKAGLSLEEVDTFLDQRQYEPLVVLLGSLVGFPRPARVLFQKLCEAEGSQLIPDFLRSLGSARMDWHAFDQRPGDDEDWHNMVVGIDQVLKVFETRAILVNGTVDHYRPWVRPVQRYSFDGALAAVGRSMSPVPDDQLPPAASTTHGRADRAQPADRNSS